MPKQILVLVIGVIVLCALGEPTLGQDVPAPQFSQPPDTEPSAGEVTAQPFDDTTNIFSCAQTALSAKFPFDILGGTVNNGNNNGNNNANGSGSNCPRITFFDGTPGAVEYDACFLLDVISLLKYPTIIGFAIYSIVNL